MTGHGVVAPTEIEAARKVLSDFVVWQAALTAECVGFGWQPTDDAPDTYDRLSAAFTECLVSGEPLPVATVNVEPSIFTSAEVNYAMRFWHDVTHVELGQDFGFAGEMTVAERHLASSVAAGSGEGSVAWRLLRADTVGQNLLYAMTGGGFVADQWAFACTALRSDLPVAVLEAVEQFEQRPVVSEDIDRLRVLLEGPS